jgi:hypothetical protein
MKSPTGVSSVIPVKTGIHRMRWVWRYDIGGHDFDRFWCKTALHKASDMPLPIFRGLASSGRNTHESHIAIRQLRQINIFFLLF